MPTLENFPRVLRAMFVNQPHMTHQVLHYLALGSLFYLISYPSSPGCFRFSYWPSCVFWIHKASLHLRPQGLAVLSPGKLSLDIHIASHLHLGLCSHVHLIKRGLPNLILPLLPITLHLLYSALFSFLALITPWHYLYIYLFIICLLFHVEWPPSDIYWNKKKQRKTKISKFTEWINERCGLTSTCIETCMTSSYDHIAL